MRYLIFALLILLSDYCFGQVVEVQFVSAGFNDAGHKVRGDTIKPPGQFVIRGTQTPVAFVNTVPVIAASPAIVSLPSIFFTPVSTASSGSVAFVTQQWRFPGTTQ